MFVQNRVFCLLHLHSTPPLGGFPSEYRHPVWYGKTRIVWLPDSEKLLMIGLCLFVLTQLTSVTDIQAHTHRHRVTQAQAVKTACACVLRFFGAMSSNGCRPPVTVGVSWWSATVAGCWVLQSLVEGLSRLRETNSQWEGIPIGNGPRKKNNIWRHQYELAMTQIYFRWRL